MDVLNASERNIVDSTAEIPFIEENSERISPSRNSLRDQENSTVMCQELILIKSQLRQLQDKNFELQKNNLVLKSQLRPQHDMIFEMQKNNLDLRCQLRLQQDMIFELQKNNWVLKSQLEPQQDMIFELRKNNSDLRSRVKQQYELTSELRKQELTEIHRLKLQLSLDERLHLQQTQVDQGPTADRKQSVEFDNVATIQQSQGRNLEEVEQTAHLTPLYQGQADNFDQSESSLKQIHSIRNSKDTAKRITYNMESSEASGKNPRNYCKRKSKTHSCGECNKLFNYKCHLTAHLRVHSGEKPYKCKVCNSAFRQMNHLKIHQRIHTGERPYKCKQCSTTFRDPSTFRKHQQTHSHKRNERKVCESTGTI